MNQIKEQTNPNLLIQTLNGDGKESKPQTRGIWFPRNGYTLWYVEHGQLMKLQTTSPKKTTGEDTTTTKVSFLLPLCPFLFLLLLFWELVSIGEIELQCVSESNWGLLRVVGVSPSERFENEGQCRMNWELGLLFSAERWPGFWKETVALFYSEV